MVATFTRTAHRSIAEATGRSSDSEEVTLHLWDTVLGSLQIDLPRLPEEVSFSARHHRLACSYLDQSIHLIDTRNGKTMAVFEGYGTVLGFAGDGEVLLGVRPEGGVFRYLGSEQEGASQDRGRQLPLLEQCHDRVAAVQAANQAEKISVGLESKSVLPPTHGRKDDRAQD
jgi:hypothetical protein